jgi:hypothetical protein
MFGTKLAEDFFCTQSKVFSRETSAMELKVSILVYSSETNGVGERLMEAIQPLASSEKIETYRTLKRFSQRLRQPLNRFDVAVLLTLHKKELLEILSIRDLFSDVRIVLILPDSDKDTVSKGHALYPRFVTYVDSDFKDLAVFFKKLFELQHSKK